MSLSADLIKELQGANLMPETLGLANENLATAIIRKYFIKVYQQAVEEDHCAHNRKSGYIAPTVDQCKL